MPRTLSIPDNNKLPEFGTPSITQRLAAEMWLQNRLEQLRKQSASAGQEGRPE